MVAVTIFSDSGVQENKIVNASTSSPFICHEVMELDAMTLTQRVTPSTVPNGHKDQAVITYFHKYIKKMTMYCCI